MPQTSGFRSAKEKVVVSFATQPRAFTLSDRNIFYTPPGGGGRTTAGSNAHGAFLVLCTIPEGFFRTGWWMSSYIVVRMTETRRWKKNLKVFNVHSMYN